MLSIIISCTNKTTEILVMSLRVITVIICDPIYLLYHRLTAHLFSLSFTHMMMSYAPNSSAVIFQKRSAFFHRIL